MKVLSKLNSLDNVNDGDTRKLITKTSESGAGNVVSSISVSGDTISYTKGVNALTSHQSAFSNVKVGSSTIAADQAGDTLELVAGDNITLTPDTTNDKVTIAATNADEKVKQTANTSSNSALRVLFAPNVLDTDYTGNVNKNSNFTYNPSTKALATGGTVDGYKLAAASAKAVDTSISAGSSSANLPTSAAVATFVEGKGYTTNTGTITGVSINNTSIATSGVANITSMPASILSGAIPSTVTATTQSASDNSTKIATTAFVQTAIDNLPDPMIFKGSLGTGGTITALPVDGSASIGDTYKVITAGTYASKAAKVGDTFICLTKTSSANTWELIPSGDEPSGTVTSITIKGSSPITVDSESAITTSGTRTISHANSGVTAGTYRSVTVNATGHVTAGTNPTTISDYGITDAKIASGTITLGSNTITPLTSSSTLDATKLSGTIPSGCYTDTTYSAGANIDITNNVIKNTGVINVEASPGAASNGTIAITKGTSGGSSTSYVAVKGLDNAAYKDVDTSISTGSSSTKLPTSAAVATFVEGKGYTTNTGTITGVSVNGTSVATSGVANITSVPASILTGAIPSAVTATTQSSGDNSTKIATTAYADGAVSNRLEKSYSGTNINGTALWSGNSLVSTVINTQTANGNSASLSDTGIFLGDNSKGKLKISNGTNNDSIELGRTYNNNWYGLEVDSSGVSITGLKTPTNDTDAVNKQYVDNNHSIKDITNGNVYIGSLESGYYNVFAGVTLYASEETAELVLSVGRKAFMYVSHELSDGEDTVSYWILNDETDVDVDASESTAVLNNWGQILYQGVFVDSTGDSWRGSFSLKQADYVTAYDVVDNLTTNNSYKVLSARQGYLLNQNKQNTILSGTTNPTSDLGVNGDVYIKYSAS